MNGRLRGEMESGDYESDSDYYELRGVVSHQGFLDSKTLEARKEASIELDMIPSDRAWLWTASSQRYYCHRA